MAKHEAKTTEDLSSFLSRVDEVGELIKNLSSLDPTSREDALHKADAYLDKSNERPGYSATHINQIKEEEHKDRGRVTYTEDSISPEQFMKDVEADAEYRRKKRKENDLKAQKLKEVGNKLFKTGDFKEAIQYYTNAIKIISDNPILYTNRAQAYARLNQYELALDDCNTAIVLDKTFVKAHVHKGKALQRLHRFEEGLECFQQVQKIDKKQCKLVAGYIKELEKERSRFKIEQQAKVAMENQCGYDQLKRTIDTLRKSAQNLDRCCSLLSETNMILDEDIKKTWFRTCGGFKIFHENPTLSRVWNKQTTEIAAQKCLNEAVLLLIRVTENDDTNKEEFCSNVSFDPVSNALQHCYNQEVRGNSAVLVFQISQIKEGRQTILKCPNLAELVDLLLSLISHGGDVATASIGAVNNLALEETFANKFGEKIVADFFPSVLKMSDVLYITPTFKAMEYKLLQILPSTFSMVGNLAKDVEIRKKLAGNEDCWRTSQLVLKRYSREIQDSSVKFFVHAVLGFLANIIVRTDVNESFIGDLLQSFVFLLDSNESDIVERTTFILSHLVKTCVKIQEKVLKTFYPRFISLLKVSNDLTKDNIVRCLSLCAKVSSKVRLALCQEETVNTILKLLKSESTNLVGNTALCIGSCAEEAAFANALLTTSVIQDLLRIAANEEVNNDTRYNSAIAVGKLVKSETSYLETVRDLHGFEILHDVMQKCGDPNS